MTIDKRPSGAYRIRHTENKRTYSMTVPFKPTNKEAYELIRAKIDKKQSFMTFDEAYHAYIDAKSNVLSPATLRGYASIYRNIPAWVLSVDISDFDSYTAQKLINEYARDHSPKSTRNLYTFVLSVIRLFIPDLNISATLPQKPRSEPHTPTLEDIKTLLDHAYGSAYYIPLYLAALSLRVSEICALTIDDLVDDTLTINKALVRAETGYVLKPTPKTDASNRTITIPHDLAEYIRAQGYVYKGYPQNIDKYLRRTLPKLGIEFFSVHKMRHFFASYSHDLGYSDAIIQKIGGWSSDVMKRVYRHAMNEETTKQKVADDFTF